MRWVGGNNARRIIGLPVAFAVVAMTEENEYAAADLQPLLDELGATSDLGRFGRGITPDPRGRPRRHSYWPG